MNDLISRQAAIDAMESAKWYHQNQNKDMVRGANSAEHQAWYKADDVYRVLEQLPPAQPEIIRCKECKWWGYDDDYGVVRMCHAAKHNYVSPHWNVFICRTYKGDYYCADAERRKDERSDQQTGGD